MKNIKVGFTKLETIFHLSDVHIRLLKRHQEYREVFEKLYDEISTRLAGKNAVIVVAGDTFHTKIELSPESVELAAEFFSKLAEIAHVLVTIGNHDCNANNPSRSDSLQPIIELLDNSNVHYIRDTGVYEIADVKFVVWNFMDDSNKYPRASEIDGDTKIAIFHGIVDSAVTDQGYKLPHADVSIKDFDGFDMVLLGDIHKHQYLNKEKTISYAGSLIQQNHGELQNKGFLQWSVSSRSAEFVPIKNQFGYFTIDIANGEIISDLSEIPAQPRLRVRVENTPAADVTRILTDIRKKYTVAETSVSKINTVAQDKDEDSEDVQISNLRDVAYQNELIEKYLTRTYAAPSEVLDRVYKINGDMNSRLSVLDVHRNVQWVPQSFEFSNMFSYGPDNRIDFSGLKGIAGLFAPNKTGKSSVLDALEFCVFDSTSKTNLAGNVINNQKDEFSSKFHFVVDGVDYYIERNGVKKPSGSVKVNVDFWKEVDGVSESLNGEQRRDTNKNIRSVLGSLDDFLLTSISVQNKNTTFIDSKQSERKDILAQFLGLDVFDELHELVKKESADAAAAVRQYEKEDFTEQLAVTESGLSRMNTELASIQATKDDRIAKEAEAQTVVTELAEKLRAIPTESVDIDTLTATQDRLIERIDKVSVLQDELDAQTEKNKQAYIDIEEKFGVYDKRDIVVEYSALLDVEQELKNCDRDLNVIESDIKGKKGGLNTLGRFEWDEDCSFCAKNAELVSDDTVLVKQQIADLRQQWDIAMVTKRATEGKLDAVKHVRDEYSAYNKLVNDRDKIKTDQLQCNSKKTDAVTVKQQLDVELLKTKADIEKWNKAKADIAHNEKINAKLVAAKDVVQHVKSDINQLEQSIRTITGQIAISNNTVESLHTSIIKMKALEEAYLAYQYYEESVHRDGVPYDLLETILPTLEVEINSILESVIDFRILLTLDGKNVNIVIVYSENQMWPLDMGSGMEKFLSSVAIRVALAGVSTLPRPNFLVIDEGFSNLDSSNLIAMEMLFDYLKERFSFIIVISHLEILRDFATQFINIQVSEDFSQIVFP